MNKKWFTRLRDLKGEKNLSNDDCSPLLHKIRITPSLIYFFRSRNGTLIKLQGETGLTQKELKGRKKRLHCVKDFVRKLIDGLISNKSCLLIMLERSLIVLLKLVNKVSSIPGSLITPAGEVWTAYGTQQDQRTPPEQRSTGRFPCIQQFIPTPQEYCSPW